MTTYSPDFNVNDFELRGNVNEFLTADQTGNVINTGLRVKAQIDWLAQLLGWSGDNYWNSFNASIDQKRQLLTGSFGVYNGFVYPEIVEVRNWEDTVITKYDPYIEASQIFYLGNSEYVPSSIKKEGDLLAISFDSLDDQFYTDLGNGVQLGALSPSAIPAPFVRDNVKASGDRSFSCKISEGIITLYPDFDSEGRFPYIYNTFFLGSRYYFDLPVKLIISDELFIAPTYIFELERWYLDIPCDLTSKSTGLSARLDYEGSFLIVNLSIWEDPSDWVTKDNVSLFKGVWGNKGGKLPFHFAFDALSLHGFNEEKSIYLPSVVRSLSFDQLLEFVYQQKVAIEPTPPVVFKENQVWWNSQNGVFSIASKDVFNCGPWIETEYILQYDQDVIPDYVFPDVTSFRDYTEDFSDGDIVQILDCSGLDNSDNILGLTTLTPMLSSGRVVIFKPKGGVGWIPYEFVYSDTLDFEADAEKLPPYAKVSIINAEGLSESGSGYQVGNLKITVDGQYEVVLMKSGGNGVWFLSPPSELKYIGSTRLFKSSKDYDNPVDGEAIWDYDNPDLSNRAASIFYYNRWEYNSIKEEWELKGDWIGLNKEQFSTPPEEEVNYSAVLVYCDGNLLESGVTFLSDDYQIVYEANEVTGEFVFTYSPMSYQGTVRFPGITISDSLTSSFTFNVTEMLFSGMTYYMSPNVEDSETLLRVWKSENLFCVDSIDDYTSLSYPNALVADENNGPQSLSWERYFLRLPPSYQRNGSSWQKVNLVCQDFGYWGSSPNPEDMTCPEEDPKPEIYDEIFALGKGVNTYRYVYLEPFLYSAIVSEFGKSDDYDNSTVAPSFDDPYDTFDEAEIISYDPLHERRADTDSPMGKGYGDWLGEYYRVDGCSHVSGHSVNDILNETLEPLPPPVWDSSMYKLPQTCILNKESGMVDANHYKVGYAFFAADLSSAEEAVFDFKS